MIELLNSDAVILFFCQRIFSRLLVSSTSNARRLKQSQYIKELYTDINVIPRNHNMLQPEFCGQMHIKCELSKLR